MIAMLVLAQLASATPAPTPAASLGAASTAVSAKPRTLADVARERKLGKKGVEGGTLSVAGASGMPAVAAAGDGDGGTVAHGRTWDNSRVRNAQADVQAARRGVDDAAVKKGMSSEDAAAARRKLDAARRELSQAREAAVRADR